MAEYFRELDDAAKTGCAKVAWCTSVGPAELLRAFGFRVYFPENHGALLGSSRVATDLIPAANALATRRTSARTSRATSAPGCSKNTPLTKAYGMASVPKPDVLVYNTNQCRDVQDWLAYYHRALGVPLCGIRRPAASASSGAATSTTSRPSTNR